MRHGVTQREEGGTVRIMTWETLDAFHIAVEDNGTGFDAAQSQNDGRTHIGIQNVRERLEIMCDGKLEVQGTPGVGTVATITIPKGE